MTLSPKAVVIVAGIEGEAVREALLAMLPTKVARAVVFQGTAQAEADELRDVPVTAFVDLARVPPECRLALIEDAYADVLRAVSMAERFETRRGEGGGGAR